VRASAAIGEALAREHAFVQAGDALILAVEIADFARARADIAGGHVHIRADVAVQLGHEALAEGHHFAVRLALGIEIAAALAAADGKPSEGVFEDLLKAQELDDGKVYAGMQAQAALVGANGIVELHAVAAVHPHDALIVHPRHAEKDRAIRLGEALENGLLLIGRVLFHGGRDRSEHFLGGLQEFYLVGMVGDKAFINLFYVRHGLPPSNLNAMIILPCARAVNADLQEFTWISANSDKKGRKMRLE